MKGKGKKAYWRAENEWWWSEGLGGGTNGDVVVMDVVVKMDMVMDVC